MTKLRLATYLAGAALVVAGFLVPTAAAVLVPAGTALIGLATRWPQDPPPPTAPKGPVDNQPMPPPAPPL